MEKKQRESAEASRDQLTVDLERVTQEATRFSEQVMGYFTVIKYLLTGCTY
jgi:hypothetical protein